MRTNATAIAEIDYRTEHGKLFVTFDGGDEYVYVGVPERVSVAFVHSASRSRFFQRIIRDRYPYNRI